MLKLQTYTPLFDHIVRLSELFTATVIEIECIKNEVANVLENKVFSSEHHAIKKYNEALQVCILLKDASEKERFDLACKIILSEIAVLRSYAYILTHDIKKADEVNIFLDQLVFERKKQIESWLHLVDVDKNRLLKIYQNPWPILQEILTGFTELIPLALDKGCDPNIRSPAGFGNTALTWSIANDAKESTIVLINECQQRSIPIDLNMESTFNKNTPLVLTIAKGHQKKGMMSNFELTKFLLEKGADPDKADESGFTPLHYAYLRRDAATIRLLMQHGAQSDLMNMKGETPIDMLKWDYVESKGKLYSITNGNDQGSCTFPDLTEFIINNSNCKHLQFEPAIFPQISPAESGSPSLRQNSILVNESLKLDVSQKASSQPKVCVVDEALIKEKIGIALQRYTAFQKGRKWGKVSQEVQRGTNDFFGWFSFFRHASFMGGLEKAMLLHQKYGLSSSSFLDLDQLKQDLLQKHANHRHSFASYVLDELLTIVNVNKDEGDKIRPLSNDRYNKELVTQIFDACVKIQNSHSL